VEGNSIYQLKIKDKNINILKKVTGISILFSILNLGSYHNIDINFFYWIYTTIYISIILMIFIYNTTTAYKYFKDVYIFFILTVLPTILISFYTFFYLLDTSYFIILSLMFGVLLVLIYTHSQNININYTKSAESLLKIYPQPFELLSNQFHVSTIKKEKKDNDKLISMLTNTPLWVLYILPVFIANIGISYLSSDDGTIILSGLSLLVSFGFIYIGLISYKNIYIFHEAQKILDEKEKKKKGKK